MALNHISVNLQFPFRKIVSIRIPACYPIYRCDFTVGERCSCFINQASCHGTSRTKFNDKISCRVIRANLDSGDVLSIFGVKIQRGGKMWYLATKVSRFINVKISFSPGGAEKCWRVARNTRQLGRLKRNTSAIFIEQDYCSFDGHGIQWYWRVANTGYECVSCKRCAVSLNTGATTSNNREELWAVIVFLMRHDCQCSGRRRTNAVLC